MQLGSEESRVAGLPAAARRTGTGRAKTRLLGNFHARIFYDSVTLTSSVRGAQLSAPGARPSHVGATCPGRRCSVQQMGKAKPGGEMPFQGWERNDSSRNLPLMQDGSQQRGRPVPRVCQGQLVRRPLCPGASACMSCVCPCCGGLRAPQAPWPSAKANAALWSCHAATP